MQIESPINIEELTIKTKNRVKDLGIVISAQMTVSEAEYLAKAGSFPIDLHAEESKKLYMLICSRLCSEEDIGNKMGAPTSGQVGSLIYKTGNKETPRIKLQYKIYAVRR